MTKSWRLGFSRISMTLGLVALAAVPITASAALNAYLTAVGESQGNIEGSVDIAPHEGKIEVVEYTHNVSQVIDNATGMPSGKRQHRPIRIIKPLDKASPLLTNALVNNERLTNVTIIFYRPGNTGAEQHYFTVELFDARITNISHISGSEDELLQKPAQEIVTFVYGKIIWTWEDGGISSEDNWLTSSP